MRKQELIHLHGLLAEVAGYCERGEDAVVDLATYRSLETSPTSIHQSKTDHKDAVFALVQAITSTLQDERSENVSVSAD